jgi:ABC-type antimicrobial peptide transport system permease subunit
MSSGAGFPINDLVRRRLQTGLTITTLTLSVASTLFLLLFSTRLGIGFTSITGAFTIGLTNLFSQFILFIGILAFIVGAVLTSFIVFLMMAQRTRDFGLIKAAGCPISLIGGYFMTELLTVTFLGCILGTIIGFVADFAVANLVFGAYSMGAWWFAPVVFIIFFGLAVFFGLKPILKAAKMTTIDALSTVNYYGSEIAGKHKALSHSALTWRIASRSMVRRISPTARIVVLLSIVFVLLTVSVAGGIIAKDTTISWIQKTENSSIIAIAYSRMGNQYETLLSKFTGTTTETGNFNFSDSNLAIPSTVKTKIETLSSVSSVNSRLVLFENVSEIRSWTIYNGKETWVGDQREAEIMVIGIDPTEMASDFSSKGRSLNPNSSLEVVVGDSVAQTMYYPDKKQGINFSDPLVEGMQIGGLQFKVVGVCIDPINNGYVAYVPVDKLMNATGITGSNMFFVTLNGSADRSAAIEEISSIVKSVDSDLEVFDLNLPISANEAFLSATWQTIMFIPMLSLASATICMVSYMMLSVNEQRQEFGMLRAVGVRPRLIVNLSAFESAIVLLSSFGIGLSFGVITTLMILMANPFVTATTIAVIAVWLVSAVVVMFVLSLYPAIKLSKTGILKIMA